MAETKAVLLSGAPDATLIDITHSLAPGDVRAAGYLIGRVWKQFAEGTVHLVVVDPAVGSERLGLAVRSNGHSFVAPDNGVLTAVLSHDAIIVSLPVPDAAAPTFHGRDVFAPAAARLAMGVPLEVLGTPVTDPIVSRPPTPRTEGGVVQGEVLYIDRFGTLVTNIPSGHLDSATIVVLGGGHFEATIGRTFADVDPGRLVAYGGSDGAVEVAARGRSAAEMTGLTLGAEVTLTAEQPSAR